MGKELEEEEAAWSSDNMENIDFENKEMTELMERQMSAVSILRSLVRFDDPANKEKKPFNGWKVKIEYEAKNEDGTPYHSEYWFILEKEATCVVNSFVPLRLLPAGGLYTVGRQVYREGPDD